MVSGNEQGLRGRSILVVDDHDPIRNLLINYLGTLGCQVDGASGGRQALEFMRKSTYDLVLLDVRMEDMDGLAVLKQARAAGYARNFIMMSAEGTVPSAVESIHMGAADFLLKPFELDSLNESVRGILRPDRDGASQPDARLAWRDRYAPGIIGEHPALLDIFKILERVARTDSTVLVTGESGTGKELIARAIHNRSDRSKHPLVCVNCGAIAETLIESELFGHAKGAFTGATLAREGRFAAAERSTLFLDEIGEMSLNVQVKFLRVLQEKEYVPVGETKARSTDVRIVAATNQDLEKMVAAGKFRGDLYYRLNIIPIQIPPLRERKSDIPLLISHFLEVFGQKRGRNYPGFTPQAMELMINFDWPGNIRELENTLTRMTVLDGGEGVFDVLDVPGHIRAAAPNRPIFPVASPAANHSPTGIEPAPRTFTAAEERSALVALTDRSYGTRAEPELVSPTLAAANIAGPSALDSFVENTKDSARDGLSAHSYVDPQTQPTPVPVRNGESAIAAPANAGAAIESTPIAGFSPPLLLSLPNDGIDLKRAVEAFEAALIDQALERTGGNRNQAAHLLGMNRTTLVEKLRKRKEAPRPSDG
jgi:DNA-binding NtrC family response regulator